MTKQLTIAEARAKLGMSLEEFAGLHGCTTRAVRRWETDPEHPDYRKPSGSVIGLTQAWLDGYRPGK